MSLAIPLPSHGYMVETHPYAAPLSSSASSSTSSVFSDAASQASSASSTSSHSNWDSEEWSRNQVAPPTSVDPASLSAFQPISRVSTYPQYQSAASGPTGATTESSSIVGSCKPKGSTPIGTAIRSKGQLRRLPRRLVHALPLDHGSPADSPFLRFCHPDG
jgi:hypothetical protein